MPGCNYHTYRVPTFYIERYSMIVARKIAIPLIPVFVWNILCWLGVVVLIFWLGRRFLQHVRFRIIFLGRHILVVVGCSTWFVDGTISIADRKSTLLHSSP